MGYEVAWVGLLMIGAILVFCFLGLLVDESPSEKKKTKIPYKRSLSDIFSESNDEDNQISEQKE